MNAILNAPLTNVSLFKGRPFSRIVNPLEFRSLMVSHRRMIRADVAAERMKGLRDLDTGELFLVEERQLLDR